MAIQAVILILVSTVFHTLWNSIVKKVDSTATFFFVAMSFVAVLLIPVAFYYSSLLPLISGRVWLLIVLTGLFQALYLFFLGKGYEKGALSIVYPIARSSPIIVVTIVTLFFGKTPTLLGFIGILTVVAGCFMIPLRRFSELRLERYLKSCSLYALCAACCTAGYSITDKYNLDILKEISLTHNIGCSPDFIPVFYYWMTVVPMILFLFIIAFTAERDRFFIIAKKTWKIAFLVGSLLFLTYALVLTAMLFVKNVSYVVAFRQISILLTVFVGVFILKEERFAPKIVGTVIIFIGLILVGIFGG